MVRDMLLHQVVKSTGSKLVMCKYNQHYVHHEYQKNVYFTLNNEI